MPVYLLCHLVGGRVVATAAETNTETTADANIGTTPCLLSFLSFIIYATMASSSSSSSPEIHHVPTHNTTRESVPFQLTIDDEVLEELSRSVSSG